MATKKAPTTKARSSKSSTDKSPGKPSPNKTKSMPSSGKDPKGGLTAEGRKFFAETQGSHLKPGVKGAANTPEKMKRKGSFLTRHYTHPRGPVVRDGEPTRQALQAAAWGEPIPTSVADEHKLAAKGRALLDQFHEARGDAPKPARKSPKKSATKKSAAKKSQAR